jgi:2-amino-4-hydroxy-6-hydroxymethyldihydropteridine diphosphokinase
MTQQPHWIPAWIGLGSNLDDPVSQIKRATGALDRIDRTRLIAVSGLYRNPPMGPADQPDFVNAVAALLTGLSPQALLTELQAIERLQGRDKKDVVHWGPRCIDLDLLTFGKRTLDEISLKIPHPGISGRNFVLFPLLELAPELYIPGQGRVRELVASLDGSLLDRI